jgi:hypothetical protein
MKKYAWIAALMALALVFTFVACDDGSGKSKPPTDLKDFVVNGADIVLKYCGNSGKAEHVSGNQFILDGQGDLSNVGFYWEFPEEVKGKGYGSINIEMEVISITNPDFIGLMTFAKSDFSGPVKVIDKATGKQKTGAYDYEFKLGVACEKGAAGDTAEGGDGFLDGSSAAGVKNDESFPFRLFTDRIAWQVNMYAGNITTSTWAQSDSDKATYTIAVTKVTFVGSGVADTTVDIKAIPGVTPPAATRTPATTTGTAQYTGTIAWAGALDADGKFVKDTVYTATITLVAAEGFTFDGVAADFFTVAGATTVNNAASSGVVTAVFPAADDPPPSLKVTVAGTSKETTVFEGHKATVALLSDGTGYTFKVDTSHSDTAYDHSYVVFQLDVGEALTGFTKVTFNVTGTTYKEVWLRAGNLPISGYMGETAEAVLFTASGNTLTGGPGVTLAIDPDEAALVTGTNLYFALDVRMGSGDAEITVKDIVFSKD